MTFLALIGVGCRIGRGASSCAACVRRKRIITAAGLLLSMSVLLVIGTRGFHTNDDPAMASIASGAFNGRPDVRWVFIQPTVSVPVTFLYRALPALPWYGMLLYAVQIGSVLLIADVMCRRARSLGYANLIVLSALLAAVVPRFLLSLSFTGTAFLAAIAAMVGLLDLSAHRTWRSHRLLAFAVLVLFALSISIRAPATVAAGLVGAPLLLIISARRWRMAAVAGVVLVAVVGANMLALRGSSEEYRTYLRYNAVRGELQGTPRIEASALSPERLERVGWTELDRRLFASFFFDDSETYGMERISTVASLTEPVTNLSFGGFVADVVLVYPELLLLLGLLVAASFAKGRRRVGFVSLGIAAIGLGCMVWLNMNLRLPERVALPIWTSMVLFAGVSPLAFGGLGQRHSTPSTAPVWPSFWPRLLVAVLSVASTLSVWTSPIGPVQTSAANDNSRRYLAASLEIVSRSDPSGTVLVTGAALPLEGTDPLSNVSGLDDPRLIGFGWPTFSPMFEERKRRVGLVDPMRIMLSDPSTVIFTDEAFAAMYLAFLGRESPAVLGAPALTRGPCTASAPRQCLWRLSDDSPARGVTTWKPTDLVAASGHPRGESVIGTAGVDPGGYLVAGPYVPLAERWYRLTIRYRSWSPEGDSAGTVDVAGWRGEDGQFTEGGPASSMPLVGTGGSGGSVVIEFRGDTVSSWEFRVWWNGEADVSVDSIVSEPIDAPG